MYRIESFVAVNQPYKPHNEPSLRGCQGLIWTPRAYSGSISAAQSGFWLPSSPALASALLWLARVCACSKVDGVDELARWDQRITSIDRDSVEQPAFLPCGAAVAEFCTRPVVVLVRERVR